MTNERRKRPRRAEKPQRPRPETPEVIYTQPQPLGRKKLIIRSLTVAAVVAALFVGFSLFFRVEDIIVTGTRQYTAWTVVEASGVREGDALLTFSKGKACGRIVQSLPYVREVRIGIKLPGTVNIYVEEVAVVYSVQDETEGWWLMTGDGKLVERAGAATASRHTKIQGVNIVDPQIGQEAQVFTEPESTEETEPSITVITDRERFQAALDIIGRLEANEVLGQVETVDVSDMSAICLMYADRYRVELGTTDQLARKVDMMAQAIKQMGSHQSGILDVSFKDGQELVIYRPFR